MYDFTYGGVAASSLGVYAVQRPNVPVPERNVELIEVQGMDGSLTIDYKTFKDVSLTVSCNFMATSPGQFEQQARQIKAWILNAPALSHLQFSDDSTFVRIVKKTDMGEITRQNKLIGTFDITFTCDPFMYLTDYLSEADMAQLGDINAFGAAGTNDMATSFPLFHFSGEGSVSFLITTNGKMSGGSLNLGQDVYLDTARQLAYNNNGDLVEVTIATGDWDDLSIKPGDYAIVITGATAVKWAPRWRTI